MVTITSLAEREIPEAIRLLKDTWMDTYSPVMPREILDKALSVWHNPNLLNKQLKNPDVKFFTARENGAIMAVSTIVRRSDGNIVIGRFYVHPSHQKKGIGSLLYRQSVSAFPGAALVHVEVDEHNARGMAFLRKLGFAETGSREESIEGIVIKITILEKRL